MYTEAPSQTQLAVRLEVDARALNAAVGERNALLAESPGMPKLTDPPFTALGPVRSVFVHNEGGLPSIHATVCWAPETGRSPDCM